MQRRNLLLLPLAGAALLALVAARTPHQLTSVEVQLPDSAPALPEGPGLAAVRSNCLGCHSPDMILNQPTMPKAFWQAEVAKMQKVYKAPIDEKAVPAIVDYLAAVKGPK